MIIKYCRFKINKSYSPASVSPKKLNPKLSRKDDLKKYNQQAEKLTEDTE